MSASRKSTARTPNQANTREKLILSALKLFAEYGVNGVSINQVVTDAKVLNRSAVIYHFGNREGLLRAIVERIAEELKPLQEQMLRELDEDAENPPGVKELMVALHMPVMSLFLRNEFGRNAEKLLSRMTWEFGEAGQTMMVEVFGPYLFEMAGRMQKLLPDKPRDELRLHFMLSINNLFHSLADIDLLRRTLGSEEGGKMSSKRFREESDKLFKQYLDFQIYGMAGKYLK